VGRRIVLLAIAVGLMVFGAAGAGAANNTSFTDPAGDSGTGADFRQIQVSNDYDGNVSWVLDLANRTTLAGDDFVSIFMDTDKNQSTGRFGVDFAIGVAASTVFIARGTASGFEAAPSTTLQVSADRKTITANRSELGNTTGFIFFLFSDVGETAGDEAPNGDAAYEYNLKVTPVLESIVARFSPAAPRARRVFRVASAQVITDEEERVTPERITCSATLGGKRLKGTSCRWSLPRTAAGKQLVVRITATFKGATEQFQPYRFRVRR
jgi:hypothetical protein